jgi:hypothetical protein
MKPLRPLLLTLALGCGSPPAPTPTPVVLTLHPGAQPPQAVPGHTCQPGPWGGPRTLLLRCTPDAHSPSTGQQLLDALRAHPSVHTADLNQTHHSRTKATP